jgi:hypothetical protein
MVSPDLQVGELMGFQDPVLIDRLALGSATMVIAEIIAAFLFSELANLA